MEKISMPSSSSLSSSSSSMADRIQDELVIAFDSDYDFVFDFEGLEESEGLSHWEFVDVSDANAEQQSADEIDCQEDDDDVASEDLVDSPINSVFPEITVHEPVTEDRDCNRVDYHRKGFERHTNEIDEEYEDNADIEEMVYRPVNTVLPEIPVCVPLTEHGDRHHEGLEEKDDLSDHDNLDQEFKYMFHYKDAEDRSKNDKYEDYEDDGDEFDLDDELVPWAVSSKFERQRIRKSGKRKFPKMINSKRSPSLFLKPGCVRGKHGFGLKHSY